MKSKLLILLQLLSVYTISAQLVITPGAQFSIAGNMRLTLQNIDLINNGNFTTGNSITSFTGNASSSISGSRPIQFNELEMNKINNSSVLLQRAIGVTQRILFSSGFLNLNGFNTDLGATGHLDGEQEDTRIIGPNGGEVLFNVNLNSPAGSNPANLGVFISSSQNLGNVTIRRGHQSQENGAGPGNSILRYYNIIPANNTDPDATIRFRYLDGELNGLDENSIIFFESRNTMNRVSLGFTSRDVVANFVEKIGIRSFGRFTLSGAGTSSPATDAFSLWPNPAHDKVFINIITGNESQALIKLFDSKGALVKLQRATILRGSNQLSIDIGSLPNGVYSLSVEWNNGQMKKAIQVLKQ